MRATLHWQAHARTGITTESIAVEDAMRQTTEPDQFPEENAANYVNGRFDPKGAEALRESFRRQAEVQAKLSAESRTQAQRHRPQVGTTR